MSHPLSNEVLSLRTYEQGQWLVFDLETTNHDYGSALHPDNRVVMVAWKLRGGPVRYYYGDLMDATAFWSDLEKADYLVAHNAKFEAHWLKRCGVDITSQVWYDTLLGEYVRSGNRRLFLSLDAVCKAYGFDDKEHIVDSMMKSGVSSEDIPRDKLIARCVRDVRTTEQILMRQLRGLKNSNRLHLALTRCLLTPILTEMEKTGVHLDRDEVIKVYNEYREKYGELSAKMDKLTGGINWNSGPQKAKFLYDTLKFPERTDSRGRPIRNKPSKQFPEGVPKTDKDTMEWLLTKAKTQRQKRYVELHRELSSVHAALTKNLEYFRGIVEEHGCIFYGVFNQARTGTHRLSSSGSPIEFDLPQLDIQGTKSVQLQNMPRIFKVLFSSRDDDYVVIETDGSQLEFRVAAYAGQDEQAMADIRNPDFDAHVTSAAVMNDMPYDELLEQYRSEDPVKHAVAKAMRTAAKAETFKPLYGGTTGTPDQERWYQEFQRRYNQLYQTQEGWLNEVLMNGKMVTPWGMRFYWKFRLNQQGTAIDYRTGKPIGPQVFNYAIQSLATAEIIPIALIYLWHRTRKAGLRVRFVNTVHDSVVAEVHKDDVEEYKQIAVQAFTHDVYQYLHDVYGIDFNVPLGCESTVGTHWSKGEEYAVDVEPPQWQEAA